MVIAVDIFRYNISIKSTETENNNALTCNYLNWTQVLEKQIMKEINTKNFNICSNIELQHDITQIISKNEFKQKNIPVTYLDGRSAALGYYFTKLQLRDVQKDEYIIFVEVARATSTGYIYQYEDQVYKLRKRLNVANGGINEEITEQKFFHLVKSLVKKSVTKFVIVYEKGYLKCREQIEKYFLRNDYQYKFISWSKTDGCEGLLKKGSSKENFPVFENKLENHIGLTLLHNKREFSEIEHCSQDKSVKKSGEMFFQDRPTSMKSYRVPKAVSLYPSRNSVMGIDFGTTKCSVAVSRNSQIEVVQDNVGHRSFKSFISFDQSAPIIGNVAFKRLRDRPQHVVFDVKRIVGKPKVRDIQVDDLWPFQVKDSENGVEIITKDMSRERTFTPTELTAILFKQMKEMASEFQKEHNEIEEIEEAVITVPSFFKNEEKKAIKEAAELAGIKVLDLLEEPIAGALCYIADKRRKTVKIELSETEKSIFDVSEFSDSVNDSFEITRETFEGLSKSLLQRIELRVKEALQKSDFVSIDKVVYIGGSAKMPMVKETLKKLLPKSDHYCGVDSECATAVGAMIHALQLYQDKD
ncbi:hypothetical protein FO519_007794 [Halicephalobus sp. NKZ332]|nr:hypothetical protein FO519_007794 [Halicephalobus sp. NKZ332]